MIWTEHFNSFTACILLAFFIGLFSDLALRHYLKRTDLPYTAAVTMIVTAVLLCLYGFSLTALRGILLCQILILAGAVDAVTYEIPDILHFLIVMVGLIDLQPVSAICGLLLVPIPFLIAAVKTGKIGGGDVKLMAASGFALGVSGGIWMMIWGLSMGLLWNAIFGRKKRSLPLAPFLAFGCFMALMPA